jgi:hypothetical protein
MKTHLPFCRMDIAIKSQRVHRYSQHTKGLPTSRESISIRLPKSAKNGRALNYPAIENNKLLITVRPPLPRFR